VGDRRQLSRVGVNAPDIQSLPLKVLEAKRRIASRLLDHGIRAKIWLGAQGPKMLGIAGNFDGVLLNYSNPEMIGWAINTARLRRKPKLTVGIYSPSYVHLKPDANLFRMAKVSSAVVALGTATPILKQFGLYQKIRKAQEMADASPTVEAILRMIPDEVIQAFSISMRSPNLHGYLAEVKRLGVSHVVFAYPQDYSLKTIRELARAL
jgi:hypothetical protein